MDKVTILENNMDRVTKQDVKDAIQSTERVFAEWVVQIEAGIAKIEKVEAEKPKLRHGDYGIGPAGPWCRVHGSTWWDTKDCSGPSHQDADVFIPYRLGNIFDDLKAMAEPLEEFVERGFNHHIHHSDKLHGSIMMRSSCYSIKQLEEYIMKLRRMAATVERARDDTQEKSMDSVQ